MDHFQEPHALSFWTVAKHSGNTGLLFLIFLFIRTNPALGSFVNQQHHARRTACTRPKVAAGATAFSTARVAASCKEHATGGQSEAYQEAAQDFVSILPYHSRLEKGHIKPGFFIKVQRDLPISGGWSRVSRISMRNVTNHACDSTSQHLKYSLA